MIALQARAMRAAFVFLTRVPVGGFPYSAAEWSWASAHFPLVGAALGIVLGALQTALLPLGAFAAAMLTLAALLLLTGAFHEDGLADTSDALGGAFDREKLFAILKDSRVGTYGASALVISLVGRAALLARLGDGALWAWPLVACVARVPPIGLMAAMPYATRTAEAKSREVTRARAPQACVAILWGALALAVAVVFGRVTIPRAAAIVVACLLVTLVLAVRFRVRAGGVTGDFLGATEQLNELAAFAVLAWGVADTACFP
jgi:adenosylcobinamide-GDP ribazoletransferase